MPEFAFEPSKSAVLWPERYHPGRAHAADQTFARQEIAIAAPPEAVWACLLEAERWPQWQQGIRGIHFLSHAGPVLRDRSRLRWTLDGSRLTSKVLEFEPCARLGWDVHGLGVEGYHGWVLTPSADGGTRVISEEVRSGWRTRIRRFFSPDGLKREQTRWLEALSTRAASLN